MAGNGTAVYCHDNPIIGVSTELMLGLAFEVQLQEMQ